MMKTAKVGLTTIEYDDTTKQEAEKLISILRKNYYAIGKFFKKEKIISFINNSENNYYISTTEDFKQMIEENQQKSNNQDCYISIEQESNFLKILILNQMQRLEEYDPTLAFRTDFEEYLNNIYSLLAKKYYKETNQDNKYIDFLFELNEKERENIFMWLKEKRRYELYNQLLDEQYSLITSTDKFGNMYDPFVKNNLDELINYIQQEISTNKMVSEEILETDNLPELTTENLEKMMVEYLTYIDPTLKWLQIYNEAMANGDIVYTIPDLEWYCINENGIRIISAPLSNTIKDFPNLIHEFTHYISNLIIGEYDYIYNSIREYPSLLFETHAIKFLTKKGYSEDIINELLERRQFYTQNNEFTACSIFHGLSQKEKETKITKESKEKYIVASSKKKVNIKQSSENILKIIFSIMPIDEESINSFIDEENEFILYDKNILINAYPYIVANYLTKKTLEVIDNNSSAISTIIEITENLVNESFETIVEKLGIETDFNCNKKPKQYTKKEQN